MNQDARLDLLKTAVEKSGLDGPIKDALADDIYYAQEIKDDRDPALQGIKRLVISGVRRELLTHQRVSDAITAHAAACPGGRIPKTPRDIFLRLGSQYPLFVAIVLILALKQYGLEGLARWLGVGG